jgi:hypothetical protein
LIPFNPRRVLNSLPLPALEPPCTPQISTNTTDLDLSVLKSSPPDGTELKHANSVLI